MQLRQSHRRKAHKLVDSLYTTHGTVSSHARLLLQYCAVVRDIKRPFNLLCFLKYERFITIHFHLFTTPVANTDCQLIPPCGIRVQVFSCQCDTVYTQTEVVCAPQVSEVDSLHLTPKCTRNRTPVLQDVLPRIHMIYVSDC